MFKGRYEHTIDSKGRISIPSKFKEILNKKYDDRLVITNFDGCLIAFPYEEWNNTIEQKILEEQKISPFWIMRKDMSSFLRYFYSSAIDCIIDKQGRLLIPQTLRDYANLKKDIILVGEGIFIEIFAKERWLEVVKEAEGGFDHVRETLANLWDMKSREKV